MWTLMNRACVKKKLIKKIGLFGKNEKDPLTPSLETLFTFSVFFALDHIEIQSKNSTQF